MSLNRSRWLWPALSVVLAASLAVVTVLWQRQMRVAAEKKKRQPRPPTFDKRDAAFFRALATMRGYQSKPPLAAEDAARLAAYDRLELNKQWALDHHSTPPTLATREQKFAQSSVLPLAAAMQLSLNAKPELYRYEIINKSDRSLPAPVLFKGTRWDSATELVNSAGFKSIADETERAIAIWRFACPRRVFGDPPTESGEEHDVVKFFACYGYGFCDDSARAVATLAELSGLKSRVWELDGHVVAEILANGKWRMFDADQQAYFYRAGAPTDILGVKELAVDPSAFSNLVSFRGATEYSAKYRDCFLTKADNQVSTGGTSEYRLETVLRAGERMTFTNYNWGRYFLGKFPTPPPRFYNGTITYALNARDFTKLPKEITTEPIEKGYRLRNHANKIISVELPFSYPFPIVGGLITGSPVVTQGGVQLQLEDSNHGRNVLLDLRERIRIDLNSFVAILSSDPTRQFSVTFILGPEAVLELRDFMVVSDFQFAGLALVPLEEGANEFHASFPQGSSAADFECTVSWR